MDIPCRGYSSLRFIFHSLLIFLSSKNINISFTARYSSPCRSIYCFFHPIVLIRLDYNLRSQLASTLLLVRFVSLCIESFRTWLSPIEKNHNCTIIIFHLTNDLTIKSLENKNSNCCDKQFHFSLSSDVLLKFRRVKWHSKRMKIIWMVCHSLVKVKKSLLKESYPAS